jgi:DNA-binding HxlR family transcriptional regulator
VKIKKGSLSDLILLYLEKSIDGYVRLEDFLYNTHIYAKGYDRPLKKSVLAQALKRLREKALVEQVFESENLAYRLSISGQELLYFQHEEKNWDGKWRIIIFDIPEKQRKIRRILRGKLKEWGFVA